MYLRVLGVVCSHSRSVFPTRLNAESMTETQCTTRVAPGTGFVTLWSQLLRGPRPPSVQWPPARRNGSAVGNQGTHARQGDQQWKHSQPVSPQKSSTPACSTSDSHSSVIGGSFEGGQARKMHCSIGPVGHSRIEVSAVGAFQGTSPVDSPTPCPAGRGLSRLLYQSFPTSRESSSRSGGCPGGSCQIRGGTSGRVTAIGGAQSCCKCSDHSSSQCGSIYFAIRSRGRGEFVAGNSRRVDPGTGQFARTCSATRVSSRRTQLDSVGCGASAHRAQGAVGCYGHSYRGGRYRSPSSGPFHTVLRVFEDDYRTRLRGLRGVRVGEASNPGPESGHEVRVEDSANVDPTQVDPHESQDYGSVAVVVPSEGRTSFGRVANVVRQDFERPRLKRLRLVSGTQSQGSAGTQLIHRTSAAPLVRRVALVPGSPDSTPRSIQDLSRSSNRFSALADLDDFSFEGGASSGAIQTTVPASVAHVRIAQVEAVAMDDGDTDTLVSEVAGSVSEVSFDTETEVLEHEAFVQPVLVVPAPAVAATVRSDTNSDTESSTLGTSMRNSIQILPWKFSAQSRHPCELDCSSWTTSMCEPFSNDAQL